MKGFPLRIRGHAVVFLEIASQAAELCAFFSSLSRHHMDLYGHGFLKLFSEKSPDFTFSTYLYCFPLPCAKFPDGETSAHNLLFPRDRRNTSTTGFSSGGLLRLRYTLQTTTATCVF